MKVDNIQQWLASSQRNIPYELDFFTPFKNIADSRPPPKPKLDHGKRKHRGATPARKATPIIISSAEESSSSSASSSSSHKYERRPRHKTREDRYDYKPTKPRQKTVDNNGGKMDRRRHKKLKKRAKRDVASHFVARNVASDRLTLKQPNGLFQRGKASAPVARPGLQDLTFSERAFLKLNQRNELERSASIPEKEASLDARLSKREMKEREKDAKMSQYFQQHRDGNDQNDHQGPHAKRRDGLPRPFVYETPCRQRQSVERTSPAFADLQLPGPPYLGFGERRPNAGPDSSLRRTTVPLIPHRDDAVHLHQKRRQGAEKCPNTPRLSESSPLHVSSTASGADPRAMHSPTSNFNFARFQHARLHEARREPANASRPGQHFETLGTSKQEELIRLLQELQQANTIRLTESEDIAVKPVQMAAKVTLLPELAAEEPELLADSLKDKLKALQNVDPQHPILKALEKLLKTVHSQDVGEDEKTSGEVDLTEKAPIVPSTITIATGHKDDTEGSPKPATHEGHGHTDDAASPRQDTDVAVWPDPEPKAGQDHAEGSRQEHDSSLFMLDDEVQAQQPADEVAVLDELAEAGTYTDTPLSVSGLESLPMVGAMRTTALPITQAACHVPYHSASPWPSIYEQQARIDERRNLHSEVGLRSPTKTCEWPPTPARAYSPCFSRRPGTGVSQNTMPANAIDSTSGSPFLWKTGLGTAPSRYTRSSSGYGPSATPRHTVRTDFAAHCQDGWLEQQAPLKVYDHSEHQDDGELLEMVPEGGCEVGGQDYMSVEDIQNSSPNRHLPHVELPTGLRNFWQPNVLY